jgi:DNA-binding transcriptional MerR regulator
MNISEAAEKSGLTAVTLRYYERIGLIPPVTRGNGGVRLFNESDLGWIEFIKCMRNAGLSIESLIEYTSFVRSRKRNRHCKERYPDRRTEKTAGTLRRTRNNTGKTEQKNRTLRAGP